MTVHHGLANQPGPVPIPRRLESRWGRLDLRSGLRIVKLSPSSLNLHHLIQLHQNRFDTLLTRSTKQSPRLTIRVSTDLNRFPRPGDDESHICRVTSSGADIEAATPWGISHALERLLQFIANDAAGPHLPAMILEDSPQLVWRGLLLDLARHHLPLPTLLRTLDGMAALGLNVLHLHLNDDQGFRIETPGCPELFERSGNGQYLREAEVERLLAEAATRGIRVLPELDVPGHAGALLWARPELAAGAPPKTLPRTFGVSRHALDPTLDETWALLDTVLKDLVRNFDDPYLHIGGDEVNPEVYTFRDSRRRRWCKARGLKNATDVQRWFSAEMTALVRQHGRTAIVWDEALTPDLPIDVVVQSWRGAGSLETALKAGHDALSSSGYYLDLCYPARLHYAFDPASGPAGLAAAEAALLADPALSHARNGIKQLLSSVDSLAGRSGAPRGRLLGGEACLWTELVTPELLDTRLYGRLAAVAERLWSDPAHTAIDDFYQRLPAFLAHLEAHTECQPLTGCTPLLLHGGVHAEELHHVHLLFAALEPVRWYQRLLGPTLLAERSLDAATSITEASRPYSADTPLRRPVDLLPPESLDLLCFEQELIAFAADATNGVAETELRNRAHHWREVPHALCDLRVRNHDFAQLGTFIDLLPRVANILDEWLDVRTARRENPCNLHMRLTALAEEAMAANLATEIEFAVLPPLLRALAPTPP